MKYSNSFSHPGVTAVSALHKDVLVSISAFVLTKREITGGEQVPHRWEKSDHNWQRTLLSAASYIFTFDLQARASLGAHSSLPSPERGQWDECIHH